MTTPDFNKLRKDFPMLAQKMHGHPLVYFDTAATAQKPDAVINAENDFYRNHYGTVHRAIYDLSMEATALYQGARTKVKEFLNAEKEHEIIFTRGTTESINLIANSFGRAFLKAGDEVLIAESEHHSNIVPWQFACEASGATIRVIPIDDDGVLDIEAMKGLLNEKTKMVAVAHISNALGTVNPIKAITKMAHSAGAKVLIDGAQGAPHLLTDVQDINCDFYAFSAHKTYGPTGIGILYGKEDILEAIPPFLGGGDMIEKVCFDKTTFAPLPLKFESGTPSIVQAVGLGAAIDYLQQIGLENIASFEKDLLDYITPKLQQIDGLTIIGTAKDKGAIISFTVDGLHPLDLGTLLNLKGIAVRTGHHCAQPTMTRFNVPATTRASLAMYNTTDEIDYFVDAVKTIVAQNC